MALRASIEYCHQPDLTRARGPQADCRGAHDREIVAAMVVTETTVNTYVRNILRQLGACNRVEAVARFQTGTLPPGAPCLFDYDLCTGRGSWTSTAP
jgi:hypothetical protein